MTRIWLIPPTTTTTRITTRVVIAPLRFPRSEEVRRLRGSLSKVRLFKTPTQNPLRYKTHASNGALENAGMTNLKATLQQPYATKSRGKNAPKAMSMRGGGPCGWENKTTCQNPMQTKDQKMTIAFGRRKIKSAQVTRMLKASAGSRRSSHWERDVSRRIRKETGKIVEKPMESSPWPTNGRKSVKLPVSSTDPQPPLDAEMMPLSRNQHQTISQNMDLTLVEQLRK